MLFVTDGTQGVAGVGGGAWREEGEDGWTARRVTDGNHVTTMQG